MRSSLVTFATVLAVASGSACTTPPAAAGLPVVTTTTVLADLVANVGGSDVAVSSLVPPGGDPHTFDPSPGDVARISEARLVFVNGLGLDEWTIELAEDADVPSDRVIELAEDLPGVEYIEGEAHDDAHEDEPAGSDDASHDQHTGEAVNPHLWLDVSYAAAYVARIAEHLSAADPAHAPGYRDRAAAYRDRLFALDAWAREQLGALSPESRRIVSFHDALPYFARAYGLEVVGVVVEAPGQDPSAGEIADLVDAIRSSGVRAIVSEAQFSPDLAETVAAETGAQVVADLYTDSLGEPPVDTFEGLIRYDVEALVGALR
jgi:manganese/iron transport system substrate-binding protein